MSSFQERLRKHERDGRLKPAVAAVAATKEAYELSFPSRTTISRWLEGTRPSRREWVELLARELSDPDLLVAYDEDDSTEASDEKHLITRFHGLTEDRRRAVLDHLVADVHRSSASLRENLSMRIELHTQEVAGCYRLEVALEWTGRLPKTAVVRVAPDGDDLKEAFAEEECVFRELIAMPTEDFVAAYAAIPDALPVLRWSSPNRPNLDWLVAEPAGEHPGEFRFNNPAIDAALIELRVCFPYPADLPMYSVKFGGYAVTGRTKLEMLITGPLSCSPNVISYLGGATAFDQPSPFRRRDKVVEAEGVLSPNAGAVFFWRPHHDLEGHD